MWNIPDGGLTENLTTPVLTFDRHVRKVGHVLFHPTAENVLLSSSADLLIKLYDIGLGQEIQDIAVHPDMIHSVCWNYEGSVLATTCKDKRLRLIDPRAGQVFAETECHQGVKGTRVCWMGDSPYLLTTGFSKTSDRQYMLWDARNMAEAVKTENLDTMSGGLMPFFDNDVKMLYLAGKGDGNIRYYEFADEAPYVFYLTQYQSNDPQRGLAFMPKRSLNVGECEVARAYKVTPDRVEPISLKVPRKSDQFQADIFPDTVSDKPALTAQQWFTGENAKPLLMSLAGKAGGSAAGAAGPAAYAAQRPAAAAAYQPPIQQVQPAFAAQAPVAAPAPAPVVQRHSPPVQKRESVVAEPPRQQVQATPAKTVEAPRASVVAANGHAPNVDELRRENDMLKNELIERDRTVRRLQEQLLQFKDYQIREWEERFGRAGQQV